MFLYIQFLNKNRSVNRSDLFIVTKNNFRISFPIARNRNINFINLNELTKFGKKWKKKETFTFFYSPRLIYSGPYSPTIFSSVTSTNVVINHKNFLTLILTLLPHWCKMLMPYLVPVSNY